LSIKSSTISKVREVPLTDVLAAEQIPFKRLGREAVTLCPWHADTNPSLTVSDDKNICFCFACGGGSDGIAFVQQKFGLGFTDAVIRIAEKHSILVEYDNLDPEEALRIAEQRRRAFSEVKRQHQVFRSNLKGSSGLTARKWIDSRGIKPETSREFELGYSMAGYFANRITVPIHNHRGMIVGFTGRRIDSSGEQKYKNSASSDIFDKGSLLFNEHRASEAARLSGYIIFVEGHLDVVSMYQHGIKNAVATQGTAGPSIHAIKRLLRQCRRFVLCYDGDQGGFTATENFIRVAGPLACEGELTITVARLPEGLDPDECIKQGVDLNALIEEAPSWLDWRIDFWLAGIDRSDSHRFSQAEKSIRDLVESIKSPALRQYYVDKAAKVLAADSKAAAKLAQNWNKSIPRGKYQAKWSQPTPEWVHQQVERRLLRSFVHFPETRDRLRPFGEFLRVPSHVWLWNRLMELEAHCPDLGPDVVMAILSVAEPNYVKTLRSLASPTIRLQNQDGILDHAIAVLREGEQSVR
jgi:DNA primase